MTGPATYLRTLRHLRWEQVALRAIAPLRRPDIDVAAPPPSLRPRSGVWALPAARPVSLVGAETFRFLGEERRLSEVGWDDPSVPLLWRYNLHYFDDLNARDAPKRRDLHLALINRWIAENPPGRGTAWAPYPTSLRIANWLKWFMGGAAPTSAMLGSIAAQARWLRQTLEWHVLGNHLFVNAKALWMAGRFFMGDEAEEWSATAVRILSRELPEQILGDGGQFERSPMYHALALEDVLDLVNTLRATGAPSTSLGRRFEALAPTMHRWLRLMTRPDGTLSRFNDTADGIAPDVFELERYASALGLHDDAPLPMGLHALLPSGYVRAAWSDAVAVFDTAPVAPDYLMAHGHADTLAFELSLRGRPLVVNGGTSRYGVSPERVAERGTASHSTVVVDGVDSSEVWGGFRVGRRARVVERRVEPEAGVVVAAHDGYSHLPGSPLHRRRWTLGTTGLRVDDEVVPTPRQAVARYHLAPGLRLERLEGGSWEVRSVDGGDVLAAVQVLEGRAERGLSRYSPGFGVVVPAESLDVTLVKGRASTSWSWS